MQTARSRMITWHLRKRENWRRNTRVDSCRWANEWFYAHSFRCIRTNSARVCFETRFIDIKSIRGNSHQKNLSSFADIVRIIHSISWVVIVNFDVKALISHEPKHCSCRHSGMTKNRVTGIDDLKLFVTYNVSLWTQYSHRFFNFRVLYSKTTKSIFYNIAQHLHCCIISI